MNTGTAIGSTPEQVIGSDRSTHHRFYEPRRSVELIHLCLRRVTTLVGTWRARFRAFLRSIANSLDSYSIEGYPSAVASGLARCGPHGLAYDSNRTTGCVLCLRQTTPPARPVARSWAKFGVAALLLWSLVTVVALAMGRLETIEPRRQPNAANTTKHHEIAPVWWTPRKGLPSRKFHQCSNESPDQIHSRRTRSVA